jgi:RNA polymerase sigma factor (sigma-70 family)
MNRIPVADQGNFAIRAAAGDRQAATRLVESLDKMAYQVANAHKRDGIELEDLAQTARMAVLDAARCYNIEKGVPFPVVAKMRMRAMCQKVVQANRPTSGDTRAMRAMFSSLPKVKSALVREGLPVTPENVAARMNLSIEEVSDAMRASSPYSTSMESPVRGQDGDTRLFVATLPTSDMGQDERMVRTQRCEDIRDILFNFRDSLDAAGRERDVTILNNRIFPIIDGEEVLTTAELGTHLGLTKQRVGQLEKALRQRLAERLVHLL